MKTPMQWLQDLLDALLACVREIPAAMAGCDAVPLAADGLVMANVGGPRSRELSTPLVSRLLSDGSPLLGLEPHRDCQLPKPCPGQSLRDFVFALLARARFATPEEAWEAHRPHLPEESALVVDISPRPEPGDSGSEDLLRQALVLGRCNGNLFSPRRPILWSERRLARAIRLVHCDASTFTRTEHD
ncbi:MAG: hypothetical protein ACKO2G_08670 [Verrucomicrobiales bacterium]